MTTNKYFSNLKSINKRKEFQLAMLCKRFHMTLFYNFVKVPVEFDSAIYLIGSFLKQENKTNGKPT